MTGQNGGQPRRLGGVQVGVTGGLVPEILLRKDSTFAAESLRLLESFRSCPDGESCDTFTMEKERREGLLSLIVAYVAGSRLWLVVLHPHH